MSSRVFALPAVLLYVPELLVVVFVGLYAIARVFLGPS